MLRYALAIHGGAGDLTATIADAVAAEAMRESLHAALERGQDALSHGASALEAVVLAVASLEDSPHFNAGRGAVLRSDGAVRLDASVMCGHTHRAGAIANAQRVKNPILLAERLARRMAESGGPVLVVGARADELAGEEQLPREPPAYFITAERQAQWARAHAAGRVTLDHDEHRASDPEALCPSWEAEGTGALPGQTVGAVARDAQGRLAAGTSTGGLTNADPGRVGDTPIVGAGTFADDSTCAVSATGTGESFLRCSFAHNVHLRVRLLHESLPRAVEQALQDVEGLGGRGGCVALNAAGEICMPFNTAGMPRGCIDLDGRRLVAL